MSSFTCSICHEDKPEQGQAFLDNCFHYFCLPCIREWTSVQRKAHHLDSIDAKFTPQCPLCKASYESMIHDYLDQSFRQEPTTEGAAGSTVSGSHAFILSPLQRKRRGLYFLPDAEHSERELPFKVATSWWQLVDRPEVAKWVEREVQALVLQPDVSLIQSVVTSAMQSAPQEETAWHQFVERESAAFLGDKATKFARELRRFVGSGMTVRSYDRHTEAVGPNEGGGQPALSLRHLEHLPDTFQSSGDEVGDAYGSEYGGVAGSDSEGYDDLLLNAAKRSAKVASGDGPIGQDTKKRRKKHKSSKKERRKRAKEDKEGTGHG